MVDTRARGLFLGAMAVVTLTGVGYLTGTRMPKRELRTEPAPRVVASESAPSYAELRERRRGPNARMYEQAFAALAAAVPAVWDPVAQSEADYQRALEARRSRRAYEGAPPTIPHAADPLDTSACLSCHGKDLQIGGKRAPRLPHQRLTACTQCHVPETEPAPADSRDNLFTGLSTPGPGARAWPGAPPEIPHSTWLRDDCSSCHGVVGRLGIRSTHPWRTSCRQCHLPSAVLDQRAP